MKSFFTTVVGRLVNIGSRNDPKGKGGLMSLVGESFVRGTKKYPKVIDLYREIEGIGGELDVSVGRDRFEVSVRVPKSRVEAAEDVLDEIVNNVKTNDEILQKIKIQVLMLIKELESDAQGHAMNEFENIVLEENSPLGSNVSVRQGNLDDVQSMQSIVAENTVKLRLVGQDKFEVEGELGVESDSTIKKRPRTKFIKKDLPQKVVMFGYPMGGFSEYDYSTRLVAKEILSSGLVGLVPEVIREKHSAAYYAFAIARLFHHRGMFLMGAGVAEENVAKSIGLMREIVDRVIDGDFEEKRLDMAKQKVTAWIDQYMDDPALLYSYYASWIRNGLEIPKYDEIVEQINAVTRKDAVEFYGEIFVGKPRLVVNGRLAAATEKKCKEIMK